MPWSRWAKRISQSCGGTWSRSSEIQVDLASEELGKAALDERVSSHRRQDPLPMKDVDVAFRRMELFVLGPEGFVPRFITPGQEILITWQPTTENPD
jgi:hypothetical protein